MFDESVKKFRLAVAVGTPAGGVSLMRGLGPLYGMAREDRRLEVVLPRQDELGNWLFGWDWFLGCDALLMVGPYSDAHCRLGVKAKMAGLKVWVDWDDEVGAVPGYNPHRNHYPPDKMAVRLPLLARLADVVTVSTMELARRRTSDLMSLLTEEVVKARRNGGAIMLSLPDRASGVKKELDGAHEKFRVVPNACQWDFWEMESQGSTESHPTAGGVRRVTWRGWGSHDGDLGPVVPVVREVSFLPQFSRWKWSFIGEPGWEAQEVLTGERYEFDGGVDQDPFMYMRMLAGLQPRVHMVPLRENGFNRCKSNLAWIEAICAGALVVAPDWEEWRRPGVVNYVASGESGKSVGRGFGAVLRETLEMREEERRGHVESARAFIKGRLMLRDVNKTRWEILRNFAGGI